MSESHASLSQPQTPEDQTTCSAQPYKPSPSEAEQMLLWYRMPRVLCLFLLWAVLGILPGMGIRLLIASPVTAVVGVLLGVGLGIVRGAMEWHSGKGGYTNFREAILLWVIVTLSTLALFKLPFFEIVVPGRLWRLDQ
jgi:hypothetical protein